MSEKESENDLYFMERNGGVVLLFSGYKFFRNKQYKNGSSLWMCSLKKKGCRGSLTIHVSYFYAFHNPFTTIIYSFSFTLSV